MQIVKKVIEHGGSIGIVIPKDIADFMRIKVGDLVVVDIMEKLKK